MTLYILAPFSIFFSLSCGLFFSVLVSFADSFSDRVMNAWFRKDRKSIKNKYRYLFKSRSFCESCEHPIPALYLIPILGYYLSKAKCTFCFQKISQRFLIEETAAFIYGMLLFLLHPFEGWYLGFSAALFVMAIMIARIDWHFQLIPTEFILITLVLSMTEYILKQTLFEEDSTIISLTLLIPVLWWLAFHLIRILSRYQLGLADVRLVLAFGVAAGYPAAVYMPTLAATFGILFYLGSKYFLKQNINMQSKIPFAVFLVLAFLALRLV